MRELETADDGFAHHCGHKRFGAISGKIEPASKKSTTPASAMPMPNDDAKTIEVTKSSVALVSRNVSSP